MSQRAQRGQALILVALAFVGLAAFIGLAVDAGILFTDIGHLRRGVDAASLSAANQFREGRTIAQLTASASQVLALNGLNAASAGVAVETCDTNPGDLELCHTPPRKLVRVSADLPVYFAFLPGEIFLQFGDSLRKHFNHPKLINASCMLDNGISYVVPPEAFAQGGYEPTATRLAPEAYGELFNHIVRLLEKLGL